MVPMYLLLQQDSLKLREMATYGLNLYIAQCPILPKQGRAEGTWASIRAAAPMIMAVPFSGVKLSCTLTRGFLVASSTIFLLLEHHTPTIRHSVIL